VHVAPHPLFTPDDKGNLVVTVPLTIAEAALGARVHVPTLEEPVTVKVPPGSSSGKTLRLKGKGAPKAGGGRGDLLVKLEIEVPRNLSRKEKELLEQFAREHKGSPRAHLEHWMTTSRAGSREAS
jgi:molecular chaperone DnaJ